MKKSKLVNLLKAHINKPLFTDLSEDDCESIIDFLCIHGMLIPSYDSQYNNIETEEGVTFGDLINEYCKWDDEE